MTAIILERVRNRLHARFINRACLTMKTRAGLLQSLNLLLPHNGNEAVQEALYVLHGTLKLVEELDAELHREEL